MAIQGCERTQEKTFVNQKKSPYFDYQTGKTWNRELRFDLSSFRFQVFNLNRNLMGDVGVGVYLGQVSGKHIAMTVAHIFDDLSSCENEISFLIRSQNKNYYYPCAGWNFRMNENDILFFEISTNFANIDFLKPIEISNQDLILNQQLKLISFDRTGFNNDVELSVDFSNECVLLSNQKKFIFDPDLADNRRLSSWSMAMGCDAIHGDSGAPIFDSESKLLGLLWTGKFPKNSSSQSLIPTNETQLWQDYNYFVPVTEIKKELEILMASPEVHIIDQMVLSKIYELF